MSKVKRARWRAGVDIGGTFTDLIIVDDETGAFAVGKTLTTPRSPSEAIETVLADVIQQEGTAAREIEEIIHGTTLITNAIIERKGDRTALLATHGFRDAVEIGRESRYDLYDLMIELPRPLVPRHLRFDVPERILSDGTILEEIDAEYVERLTKELAENGIEAVAISFINSYANPTNEQAAREAVLRVAPETRVSISSEVAPEIREYERTSATIANIYVQARVDRYLRELQARLKRLGFEGRFFMMLSSGGLAVLDTAIRFPIRLLESGPAAGALAAASYGQAAGHSDLVSFDMGGTTAKFCVIENGEPALTHELEFDRVYRFKKGSGLPAKVPVIEMVEIGAGGGSIARIDSLGLLKVGPESSGAEPGPACYGRGGKEPTVTDADLVLGYLNPLFFLGGEMKLDFEAARCAIQTGIATKLGISVEEAAWGIHQVVNENMANAARVHLLERGKDPRRFPLFALGGAGPVHGFRIAKALGSPSLIAPLAAGVMSTVGFLLAPLSFDCVRSWRVRLDRIDWDRANDLVRGMEMEGKALLARAGVAESEIRHKREADMRHVGQGYEIRVSLPDGELTAQSIPAMLASFKETYHQLYGRLGPPVPIEVLNWRVLSTGPKPDLNMNRTRPASSNGNPQKGRRRAYFPERGGFMETPVYDRYVLHPSMAFDGPAIVEERESTAIVGPDSRWRVDGQANLIVEFA